MGRPVGQAFWRRQDQERERKQEVERRRTESEKEGKTSRETEKKEEKQRRIFGTSNKGPRKSFGYEQTRSLNSFLLVLTCSEQLISRIKETLGIGEENMHQHPHLRFPEDWILNVWRHLTLMFQIPTSF